MQNKTIHANFSNLNDYLVAIANRSKEIDITKEIFYELSSNCKTVGIDKDVAKKLGDMAKASKSPDKELLSNTKECFEGAVDYYSKTLAQEALPSSSNSASRGSDKVLSSSRSRP